MLILNNMKKNSLLRRFASYYKPHKKIFIMDLIASFLVAAIGIGYPIITNMLMKDFIPNENVNGIIIASIVLLAIYLIRMLLRYFIQYYGHVMGVKMQAEMRKDMFDKLEKLPYSYYDNHETGKIMSRMTNDLFEISELAHHGPENIFIASITIISSFVYLMILNWILGLICFGMLPILLVISMYFRSKMKIAMTNSKIAIAKVNASIESSITGIRVTKAYTNAKTEAKKFDVYNEEFVNARSESFGAMARFFSSSQFITDAFNVLIILGGGLFIYYKIMEVSDLTTFIVSISLFISPVHQVIQFSEQFINGTTGFKRFIEIMDETEENECEGSKILENVKGDISFKDVTFSYNDSKTILNHISFDIKQGENIALIGPTGGGKTTICHLIPRFYNITSGEIKIDNQNINDFTLESLRKNIGIVQQDVFLFNGTIKENILYGNENATDEQVIEASKKANIYEYICSLEDGFDTVVGERGVKLSGGQKQRISIARVFLKDPKILILDEATSALDNTTELLIQNSLNELSKGRTTIIVAHRLSTIKNATKILVVSNGSIIESGNHDELINKKGIYYQLYMLQFKDVKEKDLLYLDNKIKMEN